MALPTATLGRQQATVLLTPVVESRLCNSGLATNLRDTRAILSLFQNERNLRLRELASLNGTFLLPRTGS